MVARYAPQELNPPMANYEFAAYTARPGADYYCLIENTSFLN